MRKQGGVIAPEDRQLVHVPTRNAGSWVTLLRGPVTDMRHACRAWGRSSGERVALFERKFVD